MIFFISLAVKASASYVTELLLARTVVLCTNIWIVSPEIPIQDIVDCCRVWESHADTEARRFSKPGPERALPIYTVNEPGCGVEDRMVAAVTIPPAAPDPLETLFRRLLPTPVVPALPPKPVPTELERLLQRLLVEAQAPNPVPPVKNGITDSPDEPIDRDWAAVVCLSCGKAGHGVSRCPKLNETFPFMLPG